MTRPPRSRILLLLAIALVSAGVTTYLTSDRLAILSQTDLARARQTWKRSGIESYDLALEVEGSGLARGLHRVEVRDHKPATATRDGTPSSGDPGAYAIDSLFGILERELELAREPSQAYGAPAGYRAYLQAKFDGRGVPVRFRRVVGGTNSWVEWRVRELKEVTPLPGSLDAAPQPASAP